MLPLADFDDKFDIDGLRLNRMALAVIYIYIFVPGQCDWFVRMTRIMGEQF